METKEKKLISDMNPFLFSEHIEIIIKNYDKKITTLDSIPTGTDITEHPEIGNIKLCYMLETAKKTFVYQNADFRLIRMRLSEPALKLLNYIELTLSYNQDIIELSTVKIKNFMEETEIKSRSTVFTAIELLCRYSFISKHYKKAQYWINPHLFFYGDRVKKYADYLKIKQNL